MKLWRCKSQPGNSCYIVAFDEEHARDVFQVQNPRVRTRSRIQVKHVDYESGRSLDSLLAGPSGVAELREGGPGGGWWSLRKIVL